MEKVLTKAGMKEAVAAGTATVAGMAGEGTLLGGIMAGVGDIAAQGYDIHTGNQTSINWKQAGKSTLAGGAAGLVMGGAMGMFSLTSAGQAFGKWMSEPTKLDMKVAEMAKSFWGNNRGSVGFGGNAYGKSIEVSEQKMYQQGKHFNKHGREMGYMSKAEYDAAAREFLSVSKDTAEIYEGVFNNSHGQLKGHEQIIIIENGKSLIIEKGTMQIVDFYEGTSLESFINIERVQ